MPLNFCHQFLGLRGRQGPSQSLCSTVQKSFGFAQLEILKQDVDLLQYLTAVFNMMNLGCELGQLVLIFKAFCDIPETMKRSRKKVDLPHQRNDSLISVFDSMDILMPISYYYVRNGDQTGDACRNRQWICHSTSGGFKCSCGKEKKISH